MTDMIMSSETQRWVRIATLFVIMTMLAITQFACSIFGGSDNDFEENDLIITSAVAVDAGHKNWHTAEGRYEPFATLLTENGYTVISLTDEFNNNVLINFDVLVISNALHTSNVSNWSLPIQSAFTQTEIDVVVQWVENGGGLLLIADHMPFPGAATDLAASFGIEMTNSFAYDPAVVPMPKPCLEEHEIDIFKRSDGSLTDNIITSGRNQNERIESIGTFLGHAFKAPAAEPILILRDGWRALLPEEAWIFDSGTSEIDVSGWLQGAKLRHGTGRVAVFGEAGMFTEQTCGPGLPFGMNAPPASQNAQFVLNVIHWLAGNLDAN